MNKAELVAFLQSIIDVKYGGLQSAFAQDTNLSPAYVNDVLRGRREPGQKVLDAIGVERIVTYQLKEGSDAR